MNKDYSSGVLLPVEATVYVQADRQMTDAERECYRNEIRRGINRSNIEVVVIPHGVTVLAVI